MPLTNEMIDAGLPHLSAFAKGRVGQAETMRRMYEIATGEKTVIPRQPQHREQRKLNPELAGVLLTLSQATEEGSSALKQVHAAHTILWLGLAAALIRSGAVERYEIVEGIQEALQRLDEKETGLVGDMTQLMKAMIMKGVEPTPPINPATRSTLDQIAKK